MNMQIGENWRLTTDAHNFTLERLNTVELKDKHTKELTGETKTDWKTVGYFGRVEHAMSFLIQQDLRDEQVTMTAEQLIERIGQTEQAILNAIKGA